MHRDVAAQEGAGIVQHRLGDGGSMDEGVQVLRDPRCIVVGRLLAREGLWAAA
jgi:hypothetical protein